MFRDRMSNNSKPPYTGLMQKVHVYEMPGGALLGTGWVITRDDGKQYAPELFDMKGVKLPEGWWYTLQVTNENKLIVMPRMTQ